VIRVFNRWTWGRFVAKRCPGCGCTPDLACTIVLPDGESTGRCVPAGAYGFRRCSACQTLAKAGPQPVAIVGRVWMGAST
jgi:hypothetical protein